MKRSRVLKLLILAVAMSLVTTALPSPWIGTLQAATGDLSVPPDLDSWQPVTPTPTQHTSHSSTPPSGSAAPAIVVTDQSVPFTDIANHWAKSDIEALYRQGIIGGDGTGRFNPEQHVAWVELIKMLVTVSHTSASPNKDTRVDLSRLQPNAWYYPYVTSAVSAGIVRSTDGKLDPQSHATRELFAAMAVRAIGKDSLAPSAASAASSFSDYDRISQWARGYVGMAKELGIMQGSGSLVVPQAMVTRAEAASMINRLLKLDLTPPTVKMAGHDTTSITLQFSKPVTASAAGALPNYEVAGLKVISAKLQADGKTVILTTAPHTVGKTYQITVKNIRDAAWNLMAQSALSCAVLAGPVARKAVYKDANHIDVLFDKELAPEATVQVKVVNRATGKQFGGPYMAEADGSTLKLMLSANMAAGASYSVALAGVKDKAGNQMAPAVLNVEINPASLPPAVTKTSIIGNNSFEVVYNKPISNLGTYTATGFASATPSFVGTDRSKVRVVVTTAEPDGGFRDQTTYTVTIRDVSDADGRTMPDTTVRVTYAREHVAPTIQSVKAVGPTAVDIQFSEPVEPVSAKSLGNYTLVRENTASFFTWSAAIGPSLSEDGKTLRLYLEDGQQFTTGLRYTLTASGVLDLAGNALQMVNRTFSYNGDQTVVPLPIALEEGTTSVTSGNTVDVVFTRNVDATTARNTDNYVLTLADDYSVHPKVISAQVDAADRRIVKLVTGPITSDVRLTVRNVKDIVGTTIVPTVVTLQRAADYWAGVTAWRAFNDRVEIVLSNSTTLTPDVRIYGANSTEPAAPNVTTEPSSDGYRVIAWYDFATRGGFSKSYTVKVAGGGIVPSAWTFTAVKDTVAPTVTRVTSLDRDKVAVQFSEEVKVPSDSVSVNGLTLIPETEDPASTWVFTIPVDPANGYSLLPLNSLQTLKIKDGVVKDQNNLPLAGAVESSFRVVADVTPPSVKSVAVTGVNTVRVTFSEPVTVDNNVFQVAKAGTALPITVVSAVQTAQDQVVLTLDLAPTATQVDYNLTIAGGVWDLATAPNQISQTTSVRFTGYKLATRTPAMTYLSDSASNTRTEILVTDNVSGQQDRIQGEVGAVESNAFVMVYVDGQLRAVTRASSDGAFSPVPLGDDNSPREVRVVAVDSNGNTAETATVITFAR